MVRKRRLNVANSDLIYSISDIKEIYFSEYEIYRLINDKFQMVEFIAQLGYISNEKSCSLCGLQILIIK